MGVTCIYILYVEFVLANVEALLSMLTRTTLLGVQHVLSANKMQLNRPTEVFTVSKKSKSQLMIYHLHPKGGTTCTFNYCRIQQLIDAI